MNQRVIVVIVIAAGCLFYSAIFYMRTGSRMRKVNSFTMIQTFVSTKFLYLVQTESCVPKHLKSVETIGNPEVCQCDVLVLSFKTVCHESPLEHVKYIFNSSANSWNLGRNLLYEATMARRENYLYYIFMDDDIILRSKIEDLNPWRVFEMFLKDIEPAVGIAEVEAAGHLNFVYNGRKEQNCTLNETPDYIPIAHFDSAFNAFHYKAVDSILPYPTKFDNISIWFAAWYATIKCEVIFAGQTVAHTKVIAINPLHRPYPRKHPDSNDWVAIMKEIEASLPEKYRNVSLFLDWKKAGHKHEQTSPVLCLPPPPPHMPIKPFAYLKSNVIVGV